MATQDEKIWSAAQLCHEWRMEIAEELLELDQLLTPIARTGHSQVSSTALDGLRKGMIRKYKNVMHQVYAYMGALGKLEYAVRPGKRFTNQKDKKVTILDLSVNQKIKYWVENPELNLNKDKMDLCAVLKNSRDSLEHCNDGDTYWWTTLGYKHDTTVIFHGKGSHSKSTGLDPLKHFEAYKSGRLNYETQVLEVQTMIQHSGKGDGWYIVMLPVEEVGNIVEELFKIEACLANEGGLKTK